MPSKLPMISLVFSTFLGFTAAATCYYPNGSIEPEHFPCTNSTKSNEGTAICCAKDFQCTSNGLCADYRYPSFNRTLRGGCTDKNWGQGCPSVCKTAWPDRDETVFFCGNGRYCCDGDNCCTREGAIILELGDPVVVAIARNTSVSGGGTGFNTMRLTMVPSSSSTGTPNSSTMSSSPTSSPESGQKSSTNATAIGAGVGVGAGIVIIAMMGGFIILRRRKRKATNTLNNTGNSTATSSAPPYDNGEAPDYGHAGDMKVSWTDPSRVHELPAFGDPTEIDAYANEVRKDFVPVRDSREKEMYAHRGR